MYFQGVAVAGSAVSVEVAADGENLPCLLISPALFIDSVDSNINLLMSPSCRRRACSLTMRSSSSVDLRL